MRVVRCLPPIALLAAAILFAETASAIHEGCVGRSELTGYQFMPNCSGIMRDPAGKEWPFTTNKLGLIAAPDYSSLPPGGTLRILVSGPSGLVNFSPDVGTVPAMERELRRRRLRTGRLRKVEVINGSMAGFDIVQSYLQLPGLLEAYKPHVVVFQSSLEAFALQQVQDHYASEEFSETGLSKRMEPNHPFWPMPRSWIPWLWRNLGARGHAVSTRFKGVRLALYKTLIRLGYGRFRSQDQFSVYTSLHLRYLKAMRDLAASHGAKFYVLQRGESVDVEKMFLQLKAVNAWYKPEWVAAKLVPWQHLTNPEYKMAYEISKTEYGARDFPVVVLGPDESYPGDYHPNDKGSERIGVAIAGAIAPSLEADFAKAR